MIATSVQIIAKALNEYFLANYSGSMGGNFVEIGNIARLEGGTGASSDDLRTSVVLSVVNTEEEKTLKNHSLYVRDGDKVDKRRPLIYLNLYLLFSCADDSYIDALRKIDIVAEFFQTQNVFAPGSDKIDRMTVEMVSTSFEQQNHIWGISGGKLLPSLLYKLRLVVIDKTPPQGAKVVEAIRDDAQVN